VRAAEDEGVGAPLDNWREVLLGALEQLIAHGDARLDELDEPRASSLGEIDLRRRRERVDVGLAGDGGDRADHCDPAVAGGTHRPADRRLDHLDDGHVVALAGIAQHSRAGRVAGDDEHLDALVDHVVEHLEGVLADVGDRLGPIGEVRGVGDVEQRLVGQQVEHRARDRQPADAAVEHPDRRVIAQFSHAPSLTGPG
jgi:hypothetical protein